MKKLISLLLTSTWLLTACAAPSGSEDFPKELLDEPIIIEMFSDFGDELSFDNLSVVKEDGGYAIGFDRGSIHYNKNVVCITLYDDQGIVLYQKSAASEHFIPYE